jgi:hypothetical protein
MPLAAVLQPVPSLEALQASSATTLASVNNVKFDCFGSLVTEIKVTAPRRAVAFLLGNSWKASRVEGPPHV